MAVKKILMLVGDYSEDYEVMCPYVTLRAVGHTVHVVAPYEKAGDTIRTSVHEYEFEDDDNYSEKPGHKFTLNATFDDIKVEEYDGVLCPGGRGTDYIRTNEDVVKIVRHFAEANKAMASICNGIQVYTVTDVLEGKSCVGFPDNKPEVIKAGGNWVEKEIIRGATKDEAVVDGNLVTAPTWGALSAMLVKFLEVLGTKIEQ